MDSAAPRVVRLGILNGEPVFRAGLRNVLASESDIEITIEESTIEQFREKLSTARVDVALVDSDSARTSIEALGDLIDQYGLNVIVQTGTQEEEFQVSLYHHGVRGIILRAISPQLLAKCIRKVGDGEMWIDNKSVVAVIESYRRRDKPMLSHSHGVKLTAKEARVLSGVIGGLRNKQIAAELNTSEQVIKNLLTKLYEKFQVGDRVTLVRLCMRSEIQAQIAELIASNPEA